MSGGLFEAEASLASWALGEMKNISRLSKNIVYNFFGQGLLLLLGFVAVKYVFKQLGEDALGIIYFTLTMNSVLCTVLELGISTTTVREVSAHFNDEPEYIRDLIRTASLFYWGGFLLLAVVVYFGAPFLVEKWINLESMDTATATLVLQIMGISALVGLPRTLYMSLFRGLQRMEFNNIIDVAATALQQFGIILILVMGGALLHVVYWIAASFGICILFYVLAVQRFFSWRALVPAYCPSVVRRNIRYSSSMTSISLFSMVHLQADKLIVSKLLPIGLFGYYGFASSVISKSRFLTSAVSLAAFPSFSSLFKEGDRATMMSQYRKLHDFLCFGTVFVFAAIPFATLPLFGYLFNPEVAETLLLPVTFLTIGYYMNATLYVPYVFSLAVGKPGISARSNFYALFVVLPVTAALIYHFGLAGAGFSWVFYHLFAYSYAIPRICSQCLEIPAGQWYLHVFKILGLIGATYGIAWLFVASGGTYSVPVLAVAYAAASLAFLVCSYLMIGGELRVTLLRLSQVLRMRRAEIV